MQARAKGAGVDRNGARRRRAWPARRLLPVAAVGGAGLAAGLLLATLQAPISRHWLGTGLLFAVLAMVATQAWLRARGRARHHEREAQRLRSLFADTGIGMWSRNFDTMASTLDDCSARIIGRHVSDMGPNPLDAWLALVHPDDLPKLAAARDQRESVFEIDYRVRHADGRWIWMNGRGIRVEQDGIDAGRRLIGIHMDVSARRIMENTLRENEHRLRSLFELSPVGIALNDLQTGRFLEANDALLRSSGYTRAELLGLTYWDLTPKDYARAETAQLESMERTDRYGPYEKEYLRKDGSRYQVLLSGVRMKDAGGREVIWSIVQDISERKAMESELAAAARLDKLTGLANRTLFMERLQRAVDRVCAGSQPLFGVLFIDFDRFKLVNDTMGHAAGDELLRQAADRLRGLLRGADLDGGGDGNVVARFGGDEFLVLLNDLKSASGAARVAERLLNGLAAPYTVQGRDIQSTASIGIVTSEQCIESAEAVVRDADVAMYEAKRSGRSCSVVFNEEMHTRLARHMTIESGLRHALGTDQFYLVYQPIVEVSSGQMASVEALVRWNHPVLGPVSPTEFIPVAEDSGLVVPLGQWVLDTACAQFMKWRAEDPEHAPRSISVNLSRAELALGHRLLERVCGVLGRHRMPAESLQLEVTEREVMRDPATSLALMNDLRKLGIRLAMDDFGTGTSSLACLRDYPFDTIKIDRSFLGDLVGQSDLMAVIHATITLVANLGKASVAEGVETAAQLAILQSMDCRYAQGYYLSRPLPADRVLLYARPVTRQAAATTA
jgi:diguanylate cyclase (GGDEF)-like protein/PAS domain S-box-containing protein